MKKETKRTRIIGVRLTNAEFEKIDKQFKTTTCNKLSEYLRRIIFEKPVVSTYRNKSMDDFMAEMIRLRADLNSLGNNFNQVVKRLNTLQHTDTLSGLLATYELDKRQLLKQVELINSFIEKQAAKW